MEIDILQKGKETKKWEERKRGERRKELRCGMCVHQLPVMSTVIMHCKHGLVKKQLKDKVQSPEFHLVHNMELLCAHTL